MATMEPVAINIKMENSSGTVYAEKVSGNIYRCLESDPFFEMITYGTEIEAKEVDGKLEFVGVHKESDYETRWYCCTREFTESPQMKALKEEVVALGGYWQIDMGGMLSVSLLHDHSGHWEKIEQLFKI